MERRAGMRSSRPILTPWECAAPSLVDDRITQRTIPEISTSSTSPGFIHTAGARRWPTPAGVPVAMTSPGRQVSEIRYERMICGSNRSSYRCRALHLRPVSLVTKVSLAGRGISSAVANTGRAGRCGKVLPAVHGKLLIVAHAAVDGSRCTATYFNASAGATWRPGRPMTTASSPSKINLSETFRAHQCAAVATKHIGEA